MKQLSRKTLDLIAGIITGDNDIAPYRTWNDLNSFWPDLQIVVDDCDRTDVTSRLKEALAITSHFNRIDSLRYEVFSKIISEILNPQNFMDEINKDKSREDIVELLNSNLRYDNMEIVSKKNKDGLPNLYLLKEINQIAVESENIQQLDHEFIKDQHQKVKNKVQTGDYDGAITNARTLVEDVMKDILKQCGKSEEDLEKDLDDLYKLIKKEMKLSVNSDTEQVLKQILSGLQSLVSGFSSLGNKMSERHATRYRASKHHAELAINSAYTIMEFLLSSYEHQQNLENKNV